MDLRYIVFCVVGLSAIWYLYRQADKHAKEVKAAYQKGFQDAYHGRNPDKKLYYNGLVIDQWCDPFLESEFGASFDYTRSRPYNDGWEAHQRNLNSLLKQYGHLFYGCTEWICSIDEMIDYIKRNRPDD